MNPPDIDVPQDIANITLDKIVSYIVFVLAIIAVLLWIRKYVKPFIDSLNNFINDWNGEAERPGVPRKPGVMEKLENLDIRVRIVEEHTKETVKELKPNSGSSFRDQVDEITKNLGRVAKRDEGEEINE